MTAAPARYASRGHASPLYNQQIELLVRSSVDPICRLWPDAISRNLRSEQRLQVKGDRLLEGGTP